MNIIERALELARDGQHRSTGSIRQTLTREGYEQVHSHLQGASIIKTIQAAIKATPLAAGASEPLKRGGTLRLKS